MFTIIFPDPCSGLSSNYSFAIFYWRQSGVCSGGWRMVARNYFKVLDNSHICLIKFVCVLVSFFGLCEVKKCKEFVKLSDYH